MLAPAPQPPVEEWRRFRETVYEISSLGNVRRVIKLHKDKSGRWIASLGRGKHYRVARLVAEVFHGPCPVGHEVNHKNGDRTDDRESNLEYVTPAQNKKHAVDHDLVVHGEAHHFSKIGSEVVFAIRAAYATGNFSQLKVAKMFGVSQNTVHCVVRGKTWRRLKK